MLKKIDAMSPACIHCIRTYLHIHTYKHLYIHTYIYTYLRTDILSHVFINVCMYPAGLMPNPATVPFGCFDDTAATAAAAAVAGGGADAAAAASITSKQARFKYE